MVSIGNPLPFEIRVFGTLNSPGHLALWLSTILLLFLHFRTRITLAILPLVVLVLLITLVRSAAGSVIMGLVVAGFMGRPGMFRLLGTGLVACVLVLAGLSAFDPSVGDRVISRLDTVQDLGEDGSARARAEIYARAPDLLQEYPFGTGIGSTGRGAVGQNSGPVVFDAGPLEVFVTFGWVGGAVYLVGFILIMLQAIIAARVSRSPAALALAVAVVGGSSILIFSNISGFLAAVLWTCAAYAATLGIAARHQPRVRA
jgi:O-antigen ligase